MKALLFIAFIVIVSCVVIPIRGKHNVDLGVNIHCDYSPHLVKVKEMGANWVRMDLNWSSIEPKRGRWDFSNPDMVIANAEKLNLKVYASLISTPKWETVSGEPNAVPQMMDWLIFVKAISERYKNRISVYGIWNEPNLEEFWQGSTEQYIEILLKPSYAVIKAISPSSQVAAPELAHLYSAKLGISDFLMQLNRRDALKSFDILSHHLYGDEDFNSKLFGFGILGVKYKSGLLQMISDAGITDKDIWITELGSNVADHNEKFQNDVILKQLETLENIPRVKKVFIYHFMDDNIHKEKWGLLRSDESLRPVYQSLKERAK